MYIIDFCTILGIYIISDYILRQRYNGVYYLIHFLNNIAVTYYSIPSLIYSYTNIIKYHEYPLDYTSSILTAALHIYHIISYYNKLRFDDYLHHGLMVFVALPLGVYLNSGSLLDHGYFYLTGPPGGINYLLLFLTRNGYIERITQKKINNYINLWFRCPGCVSQVVLSTIAFMNNYDMYSELDICIFWIINILIFWNGIYYMNQVVANYNIVLNSFHRQ